MLNKGLDPSPRSYATAVTLIRRGKDDAANYGATTVQAIEDWLLTDALNEVELLELFQSFAWRMAVADLGVDRASLHVGTLHPQLYGYAWNWERSDGLCDEVKVAEEVLLSDAYRRNPLSRVVEHGESVRTRLDTEDPTRLSPLLRDLAAKGITDYAALPLNAAGAYHNAATVASARKGGFAADAFAQIERLLMIFALHVERHIASRISKNIVTTYLGDNAGRYVLDGTIKRGSGEAIDAIIWASDLRGFSGLSERLQERELIAVLNAYFGALAGAVTAHGGDVLKFIGDGMLAVFPFARFSSEAAAAEAAIDAAQAALSALATLNNEPGALSQFGGWQPLRTGIALHRGEAFFGNVGAPQRLDFTVISPAVNAASRVEGLCKSTGRDLLITAPIAQLTSRPLEPIGQFQLRGIDEPVSVFAIGNT